MPTPPPLPIRADAADPDDPVALRSDRMFRFFAAYLAWRLTGTFRSLRLARSGPPPARDALAGRPVIVYSNHPSWWDPAVFMILADRLFPGRPGFGPMDADAFRRYAIFRRMGVFGIALDKRAGATRFLRVSERVLAAPGGMLWITAEGAFTDPRQRPLALRAGIAHLARRIPGVVLLPMALAYEFWNESKPEALVRFGAPIEPAAGRIEPAPLVETLQRALAGTMDALAADSVTRDPTRFTTVLQGRSGADPVYDAWRRFRATLRGERFSPAHEPGTPDPAASGSETSAAVAGVDR